MRDLTYPDPLDDGTVRLRPWAERDVSCVARVEAWVDPENIASRRTLERCGFELEGRLRSFREVGGRRSDALVYSRIAGGPGLSVVPSGTSRPRRTGTRGR
ncbi:GNAT family N-acetyltransferase [Cellulomonas sp.]|uniref:GNAT family N-acetyltransferase n=1 Tax=Cellulomonas sp. TaxID=40001 RepID=UPI003BAB6EDF